MTIESKFLWPKKWRFLRLSSFFDAKKTKKQKTPKKHTKKRDPPEEVVHRHVIHLTDRWNSGNRCFSGRAIDSRNSECLMVPLHRPTGTHPSVTLCHAPVTHPRLGYLCQETWPETRGIDVSQHVFRRSQHLRKSLDIPTRKHPSVTLCHAPVTPLSHEPKGPSVAYRPLRASYLL